MILPATLTASLLVLLVLMIPMNAQRPGDPEYPPMVQQWGAQVSHFHRYRIMGPVIVRILPFDTVTGFRLVTWCSSVAASLLVYCLCRSIGLSQARALVAVPMYLLTWPTLANLYQPMMVDPLAWVFVAWGLLLILQERPLWAIVVGGIGALAKEMVIPIMLLAAWSYRRHRHRASWLKLAVVLMIATAPYIWVRLVIPGAGSMAGNLVPLKDHLLRWPQVQLQQVGGWQTLFYLFAPYGVLWGLAPLGVPRIAHAQRQVLVGWLLLTIPFVMVGTPERMLEVQAPALLPLAACGLMTVPLWVAVIIVITNGIFIARIAATAVPFWLAWSSLGVAFIMSGWVWHRSLRPSQRCG